MNDILIYIGAAIIILWGIAHVIPIKYIVNGFGVITPDNTKILFMEYIAEGMTLIFLGLLPLLVVVLGDPQSATAHIVFIASAVMLLAMALLTQLTGARTLIVWYTICPVIKTIAAILFILGSVL